MYMGGTVKRLGYADNLQTVYKLFVKCLQTVCNMLASHGIQALSLVI